MAELEGLDPRLEGISPFRRGVDAAVVGCVDWLAVALTRHWVLMVNVVVAVYAFLPFAAPLLLSAGQSGPALWIYAVYSNVCHQMPSRSFFLFGQKMAYCERDTAIYLAALAAGLVFARWRYQLPRLGFGTYLLLIAPMAVDGFTQLFGWRESTWELRVFTGTLFGAASVWLTYPYFQRALDGSTRTRQA